MSIGRRLFNLARGELNALMDRVGEREGIPDATSSDPNEDLYRRYALGEFSDEELEAELERRLRTRRQSAAPSKPASSRPAAPPSKPSPPRPTASPPKPSAPPPKAAPASPRVPESVRLAYAALELPVGADFAEVRKAYRALMRKYHPDKHATSPEKQKAATELAQKLSQAYAVLEQHLRG